MGKSTFAAMRRWTFYFAAALSLVLCLAAASLWRDYATVTRYWHWSRVGRGWSWVLGASDGEMWFSHQYELSSSELTRGFSYKPERRLTRTAAIRSEIAAWPRHFTLGGFMMCHGDRFPIPHIPARGWVVALPIWSVVIAFAILPAFAIRRICTTGKRSAKGCCLICGYDLRHTRDRCPECGTIPSTLIAHPTAQS